MKRIFFLVAVLLTAAVLVLFNLLQRQPARQLKVASWNVQTFFDATRDGTEYKQFVKSDTWGKEAYEVRLMRLANAIRQINADVFALQEIENEKVLQDLYNFLCGEWRPTSSWSHAAFAKREEGPIGVAVISKLPIQHMRAHWLEVRNTGDAMPVLRPIVEIEVETKQGSLTLFLNHWKSKSGGAEESQVWRNREEGILASCVARAEGGGRAFLAMGDFNQDVEEFCVLPMGGVRLRLRRGGGFSGEGTIVSSPWFSDDGQLEHEGSYFYKGKWERIDNFFWGERVHLLTFEVAKGEWCDEGGKPRRYELWSGRGYSDHLPIVCQVAF